MKYLKFIPALFLSIGFMMAQGQTQRIKFTAPTLYPEGTAYYAAANVFFVSSVTTGTIGKVDATGNYAVFYEDHSLKSSYGMIIDTRRNKLWVCTGDANYSKYSEPSTYKKLIRLISLDLNSGQKIDDINLSNLVPGNHFANDLTMDNTGNIYVTDSYSPVIYKINTAMQATVFSQNDLFKSVDVGLNGIVWHPDGFLIVAHNTNGELYKIRVSNPGVIIKIGISQFFPGADGLYLNDRSSLAIVQNKGTDKVFYLRSADHWSNANIIGSTLLVDRFDNPTTMTKKGNKFYALNAKLNELSDPTEVPSTEFSLQEVRFIPQ